MSKWFLYGLVLFTIGCEYPYRLTSRVPEEDFGKIADTFEAIDRQILQTKCARCHETAEKKNHGVVLTSYEVIMNNGLFPPLVIPGKPEESSLYKSVASGRMPKGRARLSRAEIEAIYNWILTGAGTTPSDGEPPDYL